MGEANSSKIALESQKEKDTFRVLIESAPVGIGDIGLEPPRFKWVNKATCNILGYTKEELLAMNPFDLIVEKTQATFSKKDEKNLSRKKSNAVSLLQAQNKEWTFYMGKFEREIASQ
jgi:PAS domain S-box-containing protein